MTSQADWQARPAPTESEGGGRLFLDEHQREFIAAAVARIIPTDQDPGAAEANVVEFIDRYISGIDFVYATADGTGFLQITGKEADAWRQRIGSVQQRYAEGIEQIEELSRSRFGSGFTGLDPDQQDEILATSSGWPKPTDFAIGSVVQGRQVKAGEGGAPPSNQPIPDDELDFFPMLVLHARQGFYSDPVYGGNRGRVGWDVIGFPGPTSLAQTQRGEYSTVDYMLPDVEWPYAPGLVDAD